jgi:glycosyltransferase involved in cell wall biosynthesis
VTDANRFGRDHREFLLDVTRLVWRAWKGRRPTGIDRVCLAYLEQFGGRSLLVVRRNRFSFILSAKHSDRLARLLQSSSPGRPTLLMTLLRALAAARQTAPGKNMLYLNVGHTGLDDGALSCWVQANKVRPVYLVHDLIPLTHPQYCRPGDDQKHASRISNVLATAHGIIGNSRDTLSELGRFAASTGATLAPTIAVPIAAIESRDTVKKKMIGRPYFVTVGTIEGRKNHLLLLHIWERLIDAMGDGGPALIIIGQRGWEAADAFRKLDKLGKLAHHIKEIPDCNDEDLASWIAGARALLMPSFVEGFGLPVVEALQLGTPVIASNLPVYREIVGDIPTYLDPRDATAWEDAIQSFSGEGSERTRQLRAMKSFRPFSWDEHFGNVERWLQTVRSAKFH